ncbi:hypothetical protein A5684_00395 [Mycobacterium intracellulare]|uniref:hypothetical protein n=1 Tax=Mycobacterium intracellulare TaxID=1767 RepID=UPI0007EA04AD|nr:hypothetical protein [Mycobacterium intracellulare]OBH68041.1 hypothetical protein A5684_00395 [Mycobacterium intracellulare]
MTSLKTKAFKTAAAATGLAAVLLLPTGCTMTPADAPASGGTLGGTVGGVVGGVIGDVGGIVGGVLP